MAFSSLKNAGKAMLARLHEAAAASAAAEAEARAAVYQEAAAALAQPTAMVKWAPNGKGSKGGQSSKGIKKKITKKESKNGCQNNDKGETQGSQRQKPHKEEKRGSQSQKLDKEEKHGSQKNMAFYQQPGVVNHFSF